MSSPCLGSIRVFPYTFAPQGWALCNGQVLQIQQFTSLYAILGTTYGGNGVTTFGLPNLQGSVPVGMGQAPGLPNYDLGQQGGSPNVALTAAQVPMHTHNVRCASVEPDTDQPAGALWCNVSSEAMGAYGPVGFPIVEMSTQAVGSAGSGSPHDNTMPVLGLNFCIALVGEYPTP